MMKTDLIRQVRENSGWFMALGVVMLILGIAAIVEPFMATVAIARVFSWIFLFAVIICICLRRSISERSRFLAKASDWNPLCDYRNFLAK